MSDDELFQLLDLSDTEHLDGNAIIAELRKNPQLAAKKYTFDDGHNGTYRAFPHQRYINLKGTYTYHAYPLHQAIKLRAKIEVVEALYNCWPWAIKSRCPGKHFDRSTALHFALRFKAPIDVVLFIFRKWPEAAREKDSHGRLPLHFACLGGFSVEFISLLLDQWPDSIKRKTCYEPFLPASFKNEPFEMLSLLLSGRPGAVTKNSGRGSTPLHYACVDGATVDVVSLLVDRWPGSVREKDEYGRAPLHCVCANSAPVEVVSLLLDRWPDSAREKDDYGCVPLHCACTNGTPVEVVSLLLNIWPDSVREKDKYGRAPLHCACANGASAEVVSLLLNTWPDSVGEESENCQVPLHFACRKDHVCTEVVSLLLDQWPDSARKKDDYRYTPLHFACCHKTPLNAILMLLEHFPEAVREKTAFDKTPLDLEYMKDNFPEDAKKVLSSISQLFENEMDDDTAKETLDFFLEIEWQYGIALIIDRHPSLYKDLEIGNSIFPRFLSVVGRRCMMKTMWYVMSNELDVVEGI